MRYDLQADVRKLIDRFQISINLIPDDLLAGDVRPTNTVPVVTIGLEGKRLEQLQWGMKSEGPKIKSGFLCNAKGETVDSVFYFKFAARERRCLQPATGFFEWKEVPGQKTKQAYKMSLQSGEPFAFASLWDTRKPPTGESYRYASLITTSPNMLIQDIHDRMPAILLPEHEDEWLDPTTPLERAMQLLTSYPAEAMKVERWDMKTNASAERPTLFA